MLFYLIFLPSSGFEFSMVPSLMEVCNFGVLQHCLLYCIVDMVLVLDTQITCSIVLKHGSHTQVITLLRLSMSTRFHP